MKKLIVSVVSVLLARIAFCAVTAHLSLDCREGAKIADTTHPLIYDASWYAGGVTAKIMVEGQEIVSGAAGAYAWAPTSDGVNFLMLNVYNASDEVVGTESVFYLSREDLTELEIPEGTTEIGDYTFAGGRFTSAMIPSSVTSIGDGAFFNCSRLISISVDEGNASYCSVDGVLYDKAKKELICHPAGKSGYMAIPEGVTSIVDYAFYGCSGLTSVTIPSSVTRIGESAFSGCDGLTSITIPEGVTSIGPIAFAWCTGLTSIVIPSSVTSIEDNAFMGCSGLTSVYVSVGDTQRVKAMLSDSGIDVDSLTFIEPLGDGGPYTETVNGIEWEFTISEGKATVEYADPVEGDLEIPSVLGGCPVTSIGNQVFEGRSGLTSITIPSSVKSIGGWAFYGCSGLTSVTIPSSVKSIGSYAFGWCSGLTSVTISEGVESIAEGAFSYCDGLTSVFIPASVISGGAGWNGIESISGAFRGCYGLMDILVDADNPVYSSFDGVLYDKTQTEVVLWPCGKVGLVSIPSGVTSIGEGAFSVCSWLTTLTIPEGVERIGDFAFEGCDGLTSVTIPSSVKSIGDYAFGWCSGLTSVTILEGVESIGVGAFQSCSGLTSITIPSSVTSIGEEMFSGCSGLMSIMVDVDNPVYCSLNGLLCSKDGKTLIAGRNGDVEIPDGVTSIGDYAFYGCGGLTSVTIPSSVTRIGESAFSGCDGLEKVYVFAGDVKRVKELLVASGSELDVDSLTFVEEGKPYKDTVDGIEWTFTISKGKAILYGHYERVNSQSVVSTAISSATQGVITIPETLGGYPVTSIGDYAFYRCSGLTSVTIPEGVTSIGKEAFWNCDGLVSLTIPEGVTNIGVYAFDYCDNLKEVIIPSSVIDIGGGAFEGCEALQSIVIPSGVDVIRWGTFYHCRSLCSITLHEGLSEIEYDAFVGCSSLEMMTFPSTLSAVTDGMFYGCGRLRAVYYCSVLPPSVMLESGYGDYRGLYDGASTSLLSIVPWTPSGDEWQGRQWLQWTPPPEGTGTGDDGEQSCVVVFDANGGSCSISSNQYVMGAELGELPAATREGYVFEGWFTEATGGEQVTAATVVTEDVMFYAQWRKIEETPIATYGPWGEAEAVKNPDKLGPTMLTDMTLELNGAAGAVGDVVAAFRGDTGALCGLGKVMDESGTLSMVCYAPMGVKLHFKVWVAASGVEKPVVVDCDAKSDLTAPTSGAFLSGHALVVSDDKDLTISLGSADWHTVSFNVLPEDPSPAAVFGSVKGKIAAVTQGIEFWMPGKSSSLKAIEIGKGYWVNTKVDNVEWTVSGKTDPKAEIALEEGWNLVGYAPEAEGAVQAVLKTALAAKAVDYVTYGVEFYPGGTLKKMEPGKAYWVHAKKAYTLVYDEVSALKAVRTPLLRSVGAEVPTYGPWGESEAVKNPDKLGPTFLTDMAVEIDAEPAEYGDVVAVFRGDTGALCGLGKVMDDSGTLTVVCYAPKGVTLSFKVWLAESGMDEPVVVKCDNASKLVAPESGAFYAGHTISGSTLELIETIVPGEKVEIDTGLIGYTASGLPSGLKYTKTTGLITGSASKPTAAEGVVVKLTKKGFETEELTIVVTAIPKVAVAMEGVNSPGDTDGCKVTGAGAYLVGKKVTLKATVPKGTVFMGWFDDEGVVATQATYSFTMGKENVNLVAKFKKEVMSVGCEALSSRESFPAGVLCAEDGIKLDIETESGVKSVKVDKLPSGMKYDTKTGLIIGAPTKAGDNTVVITVTAKSGAVAKKEIEVSVAAMPVMAVGTFSGFVSVGADNLGTFTLTTTDAGKLTAKVVTAAGTVSFSGTCWDAVEEGVYRAMLTTKKGENLTLTLDSTAAWDANQLSGEFTTAEIAATKKAAAVPSRSYSVSAQKNAFGKTWYFTVVGDETTGWTLDYAATAKAAALTVTLKADGTTAIAGSLPGLPDTKGKATSFKVSASGCANIGLMREGVIAADFAPVLTVNKMKTILAIKTNLWFDRKSDHGSGVGEAQFVK